ncbi:unnamed protein product [Brachionus calyciflorus]|uniref:Uncharacterized protein n=1 Tax=Brachionus calyciflorus TaxID=104777 RepID=A0A813M697_9BILA|nr:unnamed protein product [Brachionus calyciflorus]
MHHKDTHSKSPSLSSATSYCSIPKFYPLETMFKPIEKNSDQYCTTLKRINLSSTPQQSDTSSTSSFLSNSTTTTSSSSYNQSKNSFYTSKITKNPIQLEESNALYITEDFDKKRRSDLNQRRKRNLTAISPLQIDREYCFDKFLDSLEDINNYLDQKLKNSKSKINSDSRSKRSSRRSTQPIILNNYKNEPSKIPQITIPIINSPYQIPENKMSRQIDNKKYMSLSDILNSDKSSSSPVKELTNNKIDKSTKEQNLELNDLVTVQELFEVLKLDCDEQIKKLDEIENKRKDLLRKQIEILKSLNHDFIFKNIENRITCSKQRRTKHVKNISIRFKFKRKKNKSKIIRLEKFQMIKDLVKMSNSFKLIPKLPKVLSDYSLASSIDSTNNLLRNDLKRRKWSKDAFKKKNHRNGVVINEETLTKNPRLIDLIDACKWLKEAGYKNLVQSVLEDKTPKSLETVLSEIASKNLHEYDQIAIRKRLEILYSSKGEKIDYKYLFEKILNNYDDEEDDEDESNEEEIQLGACLERDDSDLYDNFSPSSSLSSNKMPLVIDSPTSPISPNRIKCIEFQLPNDQRNSLHFTKPQNSNYINRFHSFRLDDKLKTKKNPNSNLAENSNLSKSFLDLTNLNSDKTSPESSVPSSPMELQPKPKTTTVVISLRKSFKKKLSEDIDNLPKLELKNEKIVACLSEKGLEDTKRERRDSGVGGSLTREIGKRREKWSSFVKSHRPSFKSSKLQLTNLNVKQIAEIKSKCFIKIEGKIEKYNQNLSKNPWNRFKTPKFIKRHQKSIDQALYKHKNVFGVPLKLNYQRYGQPLPQAIIQIMKYLRKNCTGTIGIFRKSGSKIRMNVIRDLIEKTNQFNSDEIEKKLIILNLNHYNDLNSIGSIGSGLSSQSTSKSDLITEDFSTNETMGIDLADILKQYFRELPECLFSNKQSQNLIDIFTFVPENERLEAVQYCLITLDDEYRDSIQCLLYFLHDISKNSQVHKMDARNLAICLAPTLLNLNMKDVNFSGSSSTPSSPHSQSHFFNKDTTQIMSRQCNSSLDCLTFMIENPKKVFQLPSKLYDECQSILQKDSLKYKTINFNQIVTTINIYLTDRITEMFRELKDKSRNWKRLRNDSTCEIHYKQIDDEQSLLRLWKMTIEIDSNPLEIRNKILKARTQWDEELVESKIIEQLNTQTDIFQYVMHFMAPQPSRDFCELRHWTDATHLNSKYSYLIFSSSIEHEKATLLGDLRAITLRNFYLIETVNENKCKVHQLYRGDYMGYSPEWYNKMQAYFLKRNLVNLKDSLRLKF